MTSFALRYKPTTDLGRRFTATSAHRFATFQDAEDMRMQCMNADAMETVEVEE